jgi:hypothetical protein
MKYVEPEKMFEDTYIYDCETYKRFSDRFFEPYAVGFTNLQFFNINYQRSVENIETAIRS